MHKMQSDGLFKNLVEISKLSLCVGECSKVWQCRCRWLPIHSTFKHIRCFNYRVVTLGECSDVFENLTSFSWFVAWSPIRSKAQNANICTANISHIALWLHCENTGYFNHILGCPSCISVTKEHQIGFLESSLKSFFLVPLASILFRKTYLVTFLAFQSQNHAIKKLSQGGV